MSKRYSRQSPTTVPEIRTVKRVLAAIVAGLFTFGGVYGLAASLNLTSDGLGAGSAVVASCQAATLNATYTTSYSSSLPGYQVANVTVTGLASTCYGKAYRVTLTGAGAASLGESTGTTPSSGSSFAAAVSPAVDATSVTGLTVVISG
jgi:hypothetical protein